MAKKLMDARLRLTGQLTRRLGSRPEETLFAKSKLTISTKQMSKEQKIRLARADTSMGTPTQGSPSALKTNQTETTLNMRPLISTTMAMYLRNENNQNHPSKPRTIRQSLYGTFHSHAETKTLQTTSANLGRSDT